MQIWLRNEFFWGVYSTATSQWQRHLLQRQSSPEFIKIRENEVFWCNFEKNFWKVIAPCTSRWMLQTGIFPPNQLLLHFSTCDLCVFFNELQAICIPSQIFLLPTIRTSQSSTFSWTRFSFQCFYAFLEKQKLCYKWAETFLFFFRGTFLYFHILFPTRH